MNIISLSIIAAIVVSIITGFAKKINIGLFVLVFAYFIGVFGMDLSVNQVIGMWPTSLFFQIMGISLFYGFSISNGTLRKISELTVYASRNRPSLIPVALFLLALIVSGIGPGPYSVFIFLSPLVLSISKSAGMSPLLGAAIICSGGGAGGFSRLSIGGVIVRELIETAGYTEQAVLYADKIFIFSLCAHTLIFLLVYFLTKAYKIKSPNIMKPEPFSGNQKINIALIAFTLLYVIVPIVLAAIFPESEVLVKASSRFNITFGCLIGVILALLFKVGNEADALAKVPWGTLILICGMGVLISLAVKSGTISSLAEWIATSNNTGVAPVILVMISGVIGSVASSLGVVMPSMFPTVPIIAQSTGIDPAMLFALIITAGTFAAYTPVSSAGALVVAHIDSTYDRSKVYLKLFSFPLLSEALLIGFVLLYLHF